MIGSESYSQGAHSRPKHIPQVFKLIFFFFVHIANIPEELREDHLHGHKRTQTLLKQGKYEESQLHTQSIVKVG